MKIDPPEVLNAPASAAGSPEVFQQLGQITRQLHNALTQLGVMPGLHAAAEGLPDARSRLRYIAQKTGEAADKVLTSVDIAKTEQAAIAQATRRIAADIVADPVRTVASGALLNFVADVEAGSLRVDAHLTDIMLAQDFHDLTGQVVAKVVALAGDLEDSLVKLLIQAAPVEQLPRAASEALRGPVVSSESNPEVVANQGEVDDLLASLGF